VIDSYRYDLALGIAMQFVERGPLAEAPAELNMGAAGFALDGTQVADGKSAQIWSVVNHVEAAPVALDSERQR
jgi:hypothetical protein